MMRKRIAGALLAVLLMAGAPCSAWAAEVESGSVYCFTARDFTPGEEPLVGICITALPDSSAGAMMLDTRVLQPGDILTAAQMEEMTFIPAKTEADTSAQVCYLPIYENRVETSATMSIAVFGKEDKAPVAEDSTVETYKNLSNDGKLDASDPEGEVVTFTLVRSPKRGAVEIREDGTFTYTPKNNKVGVDSFTYTATDPAGNVSREATVVVQILKPTNARQYTDTDGQDCRFEAEWLRNTGLFEGEKVGGQMCFFPEKAVTKGQFLAMAVELLEIPAQQTGLQSVPADTPQWLKPYLAAALRAGLTEGLPQADTFEADTPITGAEAAVILQNGLDLSVKEQALHRESEEEIPVWADSSLMVMRENGVQLNAEQILTRADAAKVLYRVNELALNAPGTAVFKMEQ